MVDRIQLILKTKNISASKFADEIGVQRSSISHLLSGRNNPSLEFIQKTLKRFPDINIDWLMNGKGSMYHEPDLFSSISEEKSFQNKNDTKIIGTEKDVIIDYQIEKPEIVSKPEEKPIIKPEVKIKEGKSAKGIGNASFLKEESITITHDNSQQNIKNTKKVERVIIFYSDKSFIEYLPS